MFPARTVTPLSVALPQVLRSGPLRSFEIVGCVVTSTGQRLGRARVELTGDGRGALARRTRADADGRFAFVIRGSDVDVAEADPTHLKGAGD